VESCENPKSRFEINCDIHSETERNRSNFSASGTALNKIYGILSVALGVVPFFVGYGAGAPVLGLAFAATGVLREFRAEKINRAVLAMNLVGGLISVVGIVVVLLQTYRS